MGVSKKATTVSEKGLAIIREFEGLRLKAYRDLVGVPTIGWGTTRYENGKPVKMGDVITNERADELLRFEAQAKAYAISEALKDVTLNQNQFDSLISFAYNVGVAAVAGSTLLKKVKANPNDHLIRNEFAKWDKGHLPNGTVIKISALTRRRADEAKLYFS